MTSELDALEAAIYAKERRRRRILMFIGLMAITSVVAPCLYMSWLVTGSVVEFSERREHREEEREERRIESSHRLSESQRETFEQDLTRAEASITARVQAWQAAMAQASQAVADPNIDCVFSLPSPPPLRAGEGSSFSTFDDAIGAMRLGRPNGQSFPWEIVREDLPMPDEPPRVRRFRERAAELREQANQETRLSILESTLASAATMPEQFWSYDVVILATHYLAPMADPDGRGFTPGELHGRAVLYDYRNQRIACVANVQAVTESTNVHYQSQMFNEMMTLQNMLRTEMKASIERALARALAQGSGVSP